MDRRVLCDSLIKWVSDGEPQIETERKSSLSQMKTFDLNRPINGIGDLSDGVLIAMCLKNM